MQWLVVEYASSTLSSYLTLHWGGSASDGLSLSTLHQHMTCVLQGLAHLHSRGVVHGSISPDTVVACEGVDGVTTLKVGGDGTSVLAC